MMGCVLGTRASRDDDTRRKTDNGRRRTGSEQGRGISEEVRVQKDGGRKKKIREVSGTVVDRRKPFVMLDYSQRGITSNQQGWPSWLIAVAGDAIKDWTPRRANSFEKLDKAISKFPSLLFIYTYFPFATVFYLK